MVATGRPTWLTDVALAAALTVFAQLDLRLDLDNSTPFGPPWAVTVCTLVTTGALALRRRAPLATAVTVAAAAAGPELFTVLTISLWGDFVPLLVAAYSVARHADRQRAALGVLAVATAVVVAILRVPGIDAEENIPFAFVPLTVVALVGRGLRRRDRSHAALSLHASRLAADREAWVGEAIAAERARIARELHDVVAHNVSVMVVQAGAAADLLDRDPTRPRAAAARGPEHRPAGAGRDAPACSALLRGRRRRTPRLPQPGLAELDELVEPVRGGRAAGRPPRRGRPAGRCRPGVDADRVPASSRRR